MIINLTLIQIRLYRFSKQSIINCFYIFLWMNNYNPKECEVAEKHDATEFV